MLFLLKRASNPVLAAVLVVRLSSAQQATAVSDARTGLPGVVRVPMLDLGAPRLSAALDTGYGVTESQHAEGAHHRVLGTFGLGVAPVRGIELGILSAIRNDRHPADASGSDQGTIGQTSLSGRAGTRLGQALQVGAEATVGFPGAEKIGDSLSSPALDLRALIGWVPKNGPRLAGFWGFRFDGTSGVGSNAARYRPGDRLALGLSEFNAILAGTGVVIPVGRTELLGEVSADLLVGGGAPRLTQSPLRADVGVRRAVSNHLWAELLSEFSLSSRPDIGPSSPLIPVEPRFTITIGLRYRIGPPALQQSRPAQTAPPPASTNKPAVQAPTPGEAAEPATSKVQVAVFDAAGHPLSDAVVTLSTAQGEHSLDFQSGSTFSLESVPVGRARLEVRADLMRDWVKEVEITKDMPLNLRIEMLAAPNSGQIRGLVRGFDGRALPARVYIEPGDRHEGAGADGVFSVDVAPGKYRVRVYLDGYQSQERSVEVGKNGVMVLNVDLQRAH